MSKMFTYYVSTGGNIKPREMIVPENELDPAIIELFAGNLINEFSKLPEKSKKMFVEWIKNTQI